MSHNCFVAQVVTQVILSRVTHVCGECYKELQVGDVVHYDMQHYRYLCDECQKQCIKQIPNVKETVYDDAILTLFS